MRLPTISTYRNQVQQLSKTYDNISRIQDQVSSGKKFSRTSENPVAGQHIKSINNFISRIESYNNNLSLSENRAAVMDSNIGQAISRIDRALELVQQAKNGGLTDDNRSNIAEEIKSILQEVLNIANTRDTNGEYIFSGFNSNIQAFSKTAGQYQYQGSTEGSQIEIGEGVQVLYNESGQRVFGNIKNGNGEYSISSDTLNNTGSGQLNKIDITNHSLTPQSYTITMVTNSAGDLAYEVTGSNSGQMIPTPPLISPADAPTFVKGESIEIDGGILANISGSPNDGDVFYIQPSTSQNVFKTLENIVEALTIPNTNEKNKADMGQALNQELMSLKGSFDHLVLMQTEAGNRAKLIENQNEVNSRLTFDQQKLLSHLSDTDMSVAVSELTQQLSILELSQQSYMRIQNTLFGLLSR